MTMRIILLGLVTFSFGCSRTTVHSYEADGQIPVCAEARKPAPPLSPRDYVDLLVASNRCATADDCVVHKAWGGAQRVFVHKSTDQKCLSDIYGSRVSQAQPFPKFLPKLGSPSCRDGVCVSSATGTPFEGCKLC